MGAHLLGADIGVTGCFPQKVVKRLTLQAKQFG
jgi:hypothetical protein